MEVRKITGQGTGVSVFIVSVEEEGVIEEAGMLRQSKASPVTRMASWRRWTGSEGIPQVKSSLPGGRKR